MPKLADRGNLMQHRDLLKLSPIALASTAAGHAALAQSPEPAAAET
jgi:hypothetical protein